MSENKKRLLTLEAERKFVFHGSALKIEELEPRQPMICKERLKKEIKHGNPCVSATSSADIAIFRAIINKHNFPFIDYQSSFGLDEKEDEYYFNTTDKVLSRVKGKIGYVYVLSIKNFKKFSNIEYRSENPEKPIEIISIDYNDLSDNIKIINKKS